MALGRLLRTEEVCERLGIHRATLINMHKRGTAPPRTHTNDRHWGYPEPEFELWLRSRFEQPLPDSSQKATA